MRFSPYIPLLLLLSGCTASLQELKTLAPTAEDFSGSLAAEYLAYANSEQEQGREAQAEYFAGKGLEAAKTHIVLPDEAKAQNEALAATREALIAALTSDVKHVAPQKAARAQLLFDCWNAQESANIKPATCEGGFGAAFEELQAVADILIHGKVLHYSITFADGSDSLDDEAGATIKDVAKHVKMLKKYWVDLRAQEGPMATARQNAIKSALVDVGIASTRIRPVRMDESKKVFLSNDEEAGGNRVDIAVKSYSYGKGAK